MTDPTPIRPLATPGEPRLGEAVVHLDQVAEVAESARRSAGQALLAQLNDRPELALMGLASARSSIRLARAALDNAQHAILGIEADPEADLAPAAPAAIEVTDEDVNDALADAVDSGSWGLDERSMAVMLRSVLESFARRLSARGAPAEAPQLDPPAARLVITADDVEASGNHYSRAVDSPADALGIRAALEAYARRIELGLAVGTTAPTTGIERVIGEYPPATIPAGEGDEWTGTNLEAMYGGADAPRCATCRRPYSQMEAKAGMTTCEHCPPPDRSNDEVLCDDCGHPNTEHGPVGCRSGDIADEDGTAEGCTCMRPGPDYPPLVAPDLDDEDGQATTGTAERGTYSDPAVRAAIRSTLAGEQ